MSKCPSPKYEYQENYFVKTRVIHLEWCLKCADRTSKCPSLIELENKIRWFNTNHPQQIHLCSTITDVKYIGYKR